MPVNNMFQMPGAGTVYSGEGDPQRRPLPSEVNLMTGVMMMQPPACGPIKGMHLQGTNGGQVYPRRPTPYPSPAMLMDQKRSQYPSELIMQQTFPPGYSTPQPGGGYDRGRPEIKQETTLPGSLAVPGHLRRIQATFPHTSDQAWPDFPSPPYSPVDTRTPTYPVKKKPKITARNLDEMRIPIPVKDGIIVGPFSLPHHLSVCDQTFQLEPKVLRFLQRADTDLQLLCFHEKEDMMFSKWPASVKVSVNGKPLIIRQDTNKTSQKPLYLKEFIQAGCNTLQFTATDCVCAHIFSIQMVSRPSLKCIAKEVMDKQLLTFEKCIAKIKSSFSDTSSTESCYRVQETPLKVPLKCPIMSRKMELPARGQDCRHIQCFDLVAYLQLVCDTGVWVCPICNEMATLGGLEIDAFVWRILHDRKTREVEEVEIDVEAKWNPSSSFKAIKRPWETPAGAGLGSPRVPPLPTVPPADSGHLLPSDLIAVINEGSSGQESLHLLPDIAFDPEDFLSFLDGIDLGPTIPSSWTPTYDEMATPSESPLDVLIKLFGGNPTSS